MPNDTVAATTALSTPRWLQRTMEWSKGREFAMLLLAAALQITVLLAMIVHGATPLLTGDVVLLRVVPVDPRDLFRGDYVILSYDFTRIPSAGIEGWRGWYTEEWRDRPVYVTLVSEPDKRHWRMETISTVRPVSGKYLRGVINNRGQIECGIESFYVQEGTGHTYEAAIRNRTLSAEVAVTADGQATIRRLRIE
jgi:uncharacterized membrane-anchored protein